MSHGAGPSWYDASHGAPALRSWLVGSRPPNGSSMPASFRATGLSPHRRTDVLRAARLTEPELFAEYSSVIRVRPTRVRFH